MVTKQRTSLAAAAFLGTYLVAESSSADYICNGDFYPNEGLGYGSSGRIRFTTYTEPDCGGAFIKTWYFCTTGASSGNCIANTAFHYTSTEFQTLAQNVREAVTWNLRTSVFFSGCIGGAGNCAAYLEFSAL